MTHERRTGRAGRAGRARASSRSGRESSLRRRLLVCWVALGAAGCGSPSARPPDAAAPDAGVREAGASDARVDRAPAPGEALVIETQQGRVAGSEAEGCQSWKGIPFARPPLDEHRFRLPAAALGWTGVRQASSFGPSCPQLDQNGAVIGDEDCLTLNVWRPAAPSSTTPRPVMFWIHGGGNQQGASSEPVYDGASLATQGDVVVVSTNYRLGILGFLTLPELEQEAQKERGKLAAGNYGLHDQLAALRWVNANIAAFGGDPGRVTVFGQSAGAQDTWVLIASPLARGLLSRAILHSGIGAVSEASDLKAVHAGVAAAAGCPGPASLACLRATTAATLVKAVPGQGGVGKPKIYAPNIDGELIPQRPLQAIQAGSHNHLPVIVGTTRDETLLDFGAVRSEAEYRQMAHTFYDQTYGAAQVDTAIARYPVAAYGSPRAALVALTTEQRFLCPCRLWVRGLRAAQVEPIFRYWFTAPAKRFLAGLPDLEPYGAYHAWDLVFLFDSFDKLGRPYTPTPVEAALAGSMVAYWARFAATGEPVVPGQPAWPRTTGASDPYLELGATINAADSAADLNCDFWDALGKP